MIPAPSRLSPVKGSDTLMSSRPGTIAMQSDARYYQFTVENQVLDHVKKALRNSLTADADRMGVNRKVSTVQFVTESLVRHLERLLDLEDEVGLVDPTELDKPHLAERASVLQQEHRSIRKMLTDLSEASAELTTEEEPYFQAYCRNAVTFLDQLDRHEQAEMSILQQIYNDDEGGEG